MIVEKKLTVKKCFSIIARLARLPRHISRSSYFDAITNNNLAIEADISIALRISENVASAFMIYFRFTISYGSLRYKHGLHHLVEHNKTIQLMICEIRLIPE